MTTINPSLVLGTPLDQHNSASLGLIERLMSGKYPSLPPFGIAIVDVDLEDVSAAHSPAMGRPQTAENRYITATGAEGDVDARYRQTPCRRLPQSQDCHPYRAEDGSCARARCLIPRSK